MDCWRASALAAALLLASVSPTLANLVTDPGFESCTMTFSPPPGWSVTSANTGCGMNPHSGIWSDDFAGAVSTLSQSIPTTSGVTYDFSFWLRNPDLTTNDFTASFGPDEVLHLINATDVGYAFKDFTVMAAAVSTTITFTASTDGSNWNLDDVSVTAVPTVPEPASLTVLVTGLLGLAALRRRHARPEA